MLRVVAEGTCYGNRFTNIGVNVVAMTSFAAAVDEARPLKLGDQISYLEEHRIPRIRTYVA